MLLYRRQTAIVIFIRCLVLSVAGTSTVVVPPDTGAVTASSPRDLVGGKTLRFIRQPPSPTDRRGVSGVGRLRHRDVVTFRKSRPVADVITDDYIDLSAGNHVVSDDIPSGMGKDVNERASKYRTQTSRTDVAAAETETKVDTAAATARRRLPDVIVIGAKKSGTRAILEFLKIHPDVRAAGRETHFFDRFYDRGLDWYR